ncbi:SGNH/GDSL hydrolase family protein [Nocardioides bigeumensis]|uniref:SGNH/GDSL hydrolase family protein n=1 Tax=Nocardioides bigeumensis TaxID=433657 RepID=A0ABN2YLZ5_9ACTN
MGKAGAARKLAAAAAYGGTGVSLVGGSLYGLLRAEAKLARKMIGRLDHDPPDPTGWYGRGRPGPALRVALLGDSSAAGYGVDSVLQTTGAVLASGVAKASDRRVFLRCVARTGAQTSDLAGQIAMIPVPPDVAVISIGANDVTHSVRPSHSVHHLGEAVRRLTAEGVPVVVGTCPDLGTITPIPPPLRQVARAWSRRLAAAQSIVVVEAGGRSVSLGSILGPEFAADPGRLFGPDRFHPSADGYRSMVDVLLPSVLAALGLAPDDELLPQAGRGETVLPVAKAAVEAARTPGTELDGTEVAGAERGLRGRWVELRHRRRHPRADVELPETADDPPS